MYKFVTSVLQFRSGHADTKSLRWLQVIIHKRMNSSYITHKSFYCRSVVKYGTDGHQPPLEVATNY